MELRNILAPHAVNDSTKVEQIAASLERDGWQGRSVLVLQVADYYQALTGTHRLAAAQAAGLEDVPCVEVDAEAFYGAGYEPNDLWDDDVRLSILREIGDEAAATLIEQEIAANGGAW